MKKLAMKLSVAVLRLTYLFIKPFPVKEKITFISRQSDVPSEDILLLAEAIKQKMPQIQVKLLTKRLEKGPIARLDFCRHLWLQMYHIATSRYIILDGYCIPASVLDHKKQNHIIQIWHASCALKKFGWQTVGKPAGSSRETADIMKMHRNYDYVLASSKITGEVYCRGFCVTEDKIRYVGLPHFSFLEQKTHSEKQKILGAYPKLRDKTNILYLPTFRKGRAIDVKPLARAVDFSRYNLIIRPHILGSVAGEVPEAIFDQTFSTYEWIKAADAVITDYSSLALETALAGTRLYFYIFDIDLYKRETGLNICFEKEEIGKYAATDPHQLMKLMQEPYDYEALACFKNRYLETEPERAAEDFAALLKEIGEEHA